MSESSAQRALSGARRHRAFSTRETKNLCRRKKSTRRPRSRNRKCWLNLAESTNIRASAESVELGRTSR